MKIRLALATVVAGLAFAGVPATAQAGGLDRLCPTHWVGHIFHRHEAKKAVVVKKVAKKPAKKAAKKAAPKKAAAKKPLK